MNVIEWSNAFALRYFALIAVSLIVLFALATSILFALNRRLRRVAKRYQELMTGLSGANLEDLLQEISKRVETLFIRTDGLTQDVTRLMRRQEDCTQKLGLVRFNAFADTGSDLSFSLALLDAHDCGVVITALYGREETRIYAKPVKSGKSRYSLSAEEQRAISTAGPMELSDRRRQPSGTTGSLLDDAMPKD